MTAEQETGWISLKSIAAWIIGILTTLVVGSTGTYFTWVGSNIIAMNTKLDVAMSQQQNFNQQIVAELSRIDNRIARLQVISDEDRIRITRLEAIRSK